VGRADPSVPIGTSPLEKRGEVGFGVVENFRWGRQTAMSLAGHLPLKKRGEVGFGVVEDFR